jgi:Na+/citrate or Na+/malate symporter
MIRLGGAAMREVWARIRKYWLPVGLAFVVLAVLWLVSVFPDQVGVHLDTNITMLTLSIGGGLLAASIAPKHSLRNGMLGGAALLALAGATVTVYRAALGEVNVGEYGSWEMYWLTSLFALIAFAIIGAVLGYVGGYIVRFASQERPRMHPR